MPIALSFFLQYAYPILFLWVLVEQLGVPVPSVPLLLTAGTLSATHQISGWGALAVVTVACLIADGVWYALGRRYGNRVLKLLCRLSLEASTCVAKTENYFSRNGAVTLLFAKFVPGLSTVAAPIAGQTGMPVVRFLVYDLVGCIIWAEAYLLAGRFFGDMALKSQTFFTMLGHFAVGIFVAMVLGFMGYRFYKNRRFLQKVRSMRVEGAELLAMMERAEEQGNIPPFIVDLRHPLDYLPDPRVLPGSVRVGPKEIMARGDSLPRDRDVILYCTCPSEETSAKVAMELQRIGVYRVRPLRGGFDGWKQAGYPLVEYVEPAIAAELKGSAAGSVATA